MRSRRGLPVLGSGGAGDGAGYESGGYGHLPTGCGRRCCAGRALCSAAPGLTGRAAVATALALAQGALSDLSQAALQKVFSADTEEVRQLAKHLSTHLDAMGGDGLLVHIAHSQGALITSLCRRHLTVAQRARIHVIVLGGAASISDREFGSAVNYYCTNEVWHHRALLGSLASTANRPVLAAQRAHGTWRGALWSETCALTGALKKVD